MGIQGLLPFFKKIHEHVNVSQFSGCTVAIDAYCWLHKGAFSCAEKLALGEKTDQYVSYSMKFINLFLANDIKPIMVFDGCHLPSKKSVETSRREKRELNRKKAAQFLREGRRGEARECLQRCIDITPDMALHLIKVCRDRGVDCIVAPYEADAQLAYLNKIGIAQLIITEDSDLLLFGCEKVMFKMDHSGNGVLIQQKRLNEVTEIQNGSYTFEKFRYMCILSGCDYLPSLSGIGLGKANKVFKVARQGDVQQLLKKLSTYLKANITVPQSYIDGFTAADNTFLYQLVFDPLKRALVPLNPYPPGLSVEDLVYAGPHIPAQKALQIALGNINIYTGEKFHDFNPERFVPKYAKKKKPEMLHLLSIWDKHYRVKPKTGGLHESQVVDRPSTKGKEVAVKASFRRSPRKRVREVEDNKDVVSNEELSTLYGNSSPTRKRSRASDIGEELKRFMFVSPEELAACTVRSDDDSEEEMKKEAENRVTGPLHSPEFFNSLTKAHPNSAEQGTSQEGDKENGLKSPKRNVFAQKSPSKKSRFNLNARKEEVKSRFFASAKKPVTPEVVDDKSTSVQTSVEGAVSSGKDSLLPEGYRLIHSTSTNVYNTTTVNDSVTDTPTHRKSTERTASENGKAAHNPFKFSKSKSSTLSKHSPSSQSAFNWSKFKFAKQSNSDQGQITGSLEGTRTNNPFKTVCSESKLDDLNRDSRLLCSDIKNYANDINAAKSHNTQSHSQKENFCNTRKGSNSPDSCTDNNTTADAVNNFELESAESVSESVDCLGSFPYSIDSDCLENCTGDMSKSQPSLGDSQQSISSVGDSQSSMPSLRNSQPSLLSIKDRQSSLPSIRNRLPSLPNLGDSRDNLIGNIDNKCAIAGKPKGISIYFHTKTQSQDNLPLEEEDLGAEKLAVDDVCKGGNCGGLKGDNSSDASVVFVIESDEEADAGVKSTGKQHDTKPRSSLGKATLGKFKPGCRVSGLSRRSSSKKSLVSVDTSSKQQNLKDMFSKFARPRSEQPKLERTPSDSNCSPGGVFTPEGDNSVINTHSSVQKSLTL